MKLRFWGTRGSIPTPGKSTVRYGGNTPCVEVRLRENKLVIFDAGTGIRGLGDALMENRERVKAYIIISHPHWDHIQGLPYFRPAFVAGTELTIVGPQTDNVTLRRIFADQMDTVYFPVQLSELKAKITFRPIKEGTIRVHDAKLTSCYVNHPASAFGYRLEADGKTLVYISDNEPFDPEVAASVRNVDKAVVKRFAKRKGEPNKRIFDFARGADLLIHDATYTPEEYVNRVGWGHSHYRFALEVAEKAEVKRLVLFHHDQTHGDRQIDAIVRECRREIKRLDLRLECLAAAEGMELTW
jgi:phosphoribosyl 1,2-cyclic phosphodiesterase